MYIITVSLLIYPLSLCFTPFFQPTTDPLPSHLTFHRLLGGTRLGLLPQALLREEALHQLGLRRRSEAPVAPEVVEKPRLWKNLRGFWVFWGWRWFMMFMCSAKTKQLRYPISNERPRSAFGKKRKFSGNQSLSFSQELPALRKNLTSTQTKPCWHPCRCSNLWHDKDLALDFGLILGSSFCLVETDEMK